MRVLHTSDWHLGQNFFTKSRLAEHQAFICWLLDTIKSARVDCVIIAGDVFDTGTPPSYARELYNQFVVDMHKLGCQLVVLGGNHDSVSTLNESKSLLRQLHTRVVARVGDDPSEQVLTLTDAEGKVGALLCAVPFIRPRDVVSSVAGMSGKEKQQSLDKAIREHYLTVYQHAIKERERNKLDVPVIATGHLTALGVSRSDSVRDIYIGTLEAFAAEGFPPADYIALGHIHRPQVVAKSEHIRYSGSPIALSFDELGSQKQVLIADFQGAQLNKVESVPVPAFQPMQFLKGNLSEIEKQLQQFAGQETSEQSGGAEEQTTWLSIEVREQDYLPNLQATIQTLVQDLNVDVLQLRRARQRDRRTLDQVQSETLSELSPIEVFEKRLESETFDSEQDKERLERMTCTFRQIVEEVNDKEPQ